MIKHYVWLAELDRDRRGAHRGDVDDDGDDEGMASR
jgi:hypothetical protein